MSGRFIENNSRCHQNVMFTTVKKNFVEAVFPSSASSLIRERTKLVKKHLKMAK